MKLRYFAVIAAVICVIAFMPASTLKKLYYSVIPLTQYERRTLFNSFNERSVIKIGIPGPIDDIRDTNLFLEGVQMAADELNSAGTLPLPLELVFSDDGNKMADVLSIAGAYAKDTEVAAVIGHWGSEYSISASQVYENAGIIMLTPVSTNPELTGRNLRLVFRNAPNDHDIGAFLAEYAYENGFINQVMLYSKDMTGAYVANAYENHANELGLQILDRRIIDLLMVQQNYSQWAAAKPDAVFIADIITRNKEFQNALINFDPSLPILATDAYDYDLPLSELSKSAKSIHVITFFDPENSSEAYALFRRNFFELYDREPDYWAIQGYDSVYLLAEAIQTAGSLSPDGIADALKNGQFDRVSGTIQFDGKGDAVLTNIRIKRFDYGELTYQELRGNNGG